MATIIEVNNLSKKYKYGETQLYYTLRDILMDIVKTPFKLFNQKKQITKLKKNEFWALKDISFKVEQGETIGIIGPNGAGKSTLLKVLSRITPPTKGEAVLRGRVGSLLEVGTGFQQELTGRENIYLNGAILGMKKREIDKKFEEIVNFSEMHKFLDTPVKHYSSGMYMRLAFSVAAHLDSEIMVVDEVLAVGDAKFQKKCLNKIKSITKDGTRTVLFVSHNMSAVSALCKRSIYINKGMIEYDGFTKFAIGKYINNVN
jgi:lipopolysaccharide transport system ATP-binding protein